MIRKDCFGWFDDSPIETTDPRLEQLYVENASAVNTNTPEHILDEILGLATVCDRIIKAINAQKEVKNG